MIVWCVDMLGFKLEALREESSLKEKTRPIYLDLQVCNETCFCYPFVLICVKATTPVDPRVLDAMLPYYTDFFGNPHSRTHAYGWESERAVEDARKV
jgi:cysteine desulfurase